MYAGVVLYTLKPGKKVEASRIWKESFLPAASKQGGFKGGLWLTAPEADKAIGIELWDMDIEASAFETSGLFQELMDKFRPVLAAAPTREEYSAVQITG
jgi:hypothetical protein